MKKISFKSWIEKIRLVTLRFPFTMFFLLGLAFNFFLQINNKGFEIQPHTWVFFSIGIVLSLAVSLFLEDFKNVIFDVALNLLAIILLLVYAITLPGKFLPVHYYQLIIIGLVFLLLAFVVSFLKKNKDIPFWEFSKTSILQLIISFIFAQVLMLGLSLAVFSLHELFKVDIRSEVYQNLAVICYALFAPVYFLSNVPDKTEKNKPEYSFPVFMKILGLYILLPILAIYSLILYVYLAQIIVKWELPNGWVSMLVSVLGLGGFLCMLILYPLRLENENKVVNLLSKYFPLLLLPLLVLMSVGIFRRLGEYGLTINRCYVLIINLWLYGISIYLFLSKANHLKWIIISFAAVAFLTSVGPWSVFNVTRNSLTDQLEQLLTDAHLIRSGKVSTQNNKTLTVDSISQVKLIENIRYLSNNYGKESLQKFFPSPIKDKSVSTLLRDLNLKDVNSNYLTAFYTASLDYTKSGKIDISPFGTFIKISISEEVDLVYKDRDLAIKYDDKNRILIVKNKNKSFLIPLNEKFEMIKDKNLNTDKREFTANELTIKTDDFKLIICNFNAEADIDNNFIIKTLEAYLFY